MAGKFFFLGIKIRTVLRFFISLLFRTHVNSDRSIYIFGRLVVVVVVVVLVVVEVVVIVVVVVVVVVVGKEETDTQKTQKKKKQRMKTDKNAH